MAARDGANRLNVSLAGPVARGGVDTFDR